jgi:large subunit ribosomal protein L10
MLKLEPMELVMNMVTAWDEGTIYSREILDVDAEAYIAQIQAAVQAGVNLSLNTGYITKFTAPLAIQKAFWDARALVREANIFEKEMIGDVLAKAAAQAKALEEKVPKS